MKLRNNMIRVQTGQLGNDSIEVYTKFADEVMYQINFLTDSSTIWYRVVTQL